MCEEVKKSRKYKKYGYEIRYEKIGVRDGKPIIMRGAYTIPEGYYIGRSRFAYRLWKRYGIKPQIIHDEEVCSIGFSERDQKWYGWSHRAICGFSIGDEIKEGDSTNSSGFTDEYLQEHPEKDLSLPMGFKANNLEDCKRMAIAFADSVS